MLSAIDKPGQGEIYDVPKEKQDGSSATNEEHILRENRKLRSSVEQLTTELASSEDEKLQLQSELDDLLKPIREDIFSSTLNAHLNSGEALVTGGYQTSDGRFQYAMVEPQIETLPDGRTAIRLKTNHISMPEVASTSLGLDSMNTTAGNTLQHGEVWTGEELKQVMQQDIPKTRGVRMVVAPEIVALPGEETELQIGEYQASFTPQISPDGSGVDLEFRMEEPRDTGQKDGEERSGKPAEKP